MRIAFLIKFNMITSHTTFTLQRYSTECPLVLSATISQSRDGQKVNSYILTVTYTRSTYSVTQNITQTDV